MLDMIKTKKMEIMFTLVGGICFIVFGILIGFMSDMPEFVPIFFLFGTCFVTLLITFMWNMLIFNMYVGMGKTRKSYIISTLEISVLKYAIIMVIGWLMYKIGTNLVLKKQSCAGFFEPDMGILMVFLLCGVEMMAGALILKFGAKAYWILWGISMVSCMLPARIEEAMQSPKDSILKRIAVWFMEHIEQVTRMQGIGIGLVVAFVLIAISSFMLLRQDVRA